LARPGVRGTFSQPGPSHPAVGVRLARTLARRTALYAHPAPMAELAGSALREDRYTMDKTAALENLELPDFKREALLTALALEMPNQLDTRIFTSIRGLTMIGRAGLKHFSKHPNTGVAVLATQHPMAALVVGTLSALQLGTGGVLNYQNYSNDAEDTLLAIGYLTHAPSAAIAELNMSVAGALETFLRTAVMSVFNERVSALKLISESEPDNSDVTERLRIYTAGLAQSEALQAELLTVLRQKERERDDQLGQKKAAFEISGHSIQEQRDALEVRYKAGLVSHEDYSESKSKIFSASLKLKGMKLANSAIGLTKLEVAGDSGSRDLLDFYRSICKLPAPPMHSPQEASYENRSQQSLWTKLAIAAAICLLVYFGVQAVLE
jgi:hypothetical protein